MREWRDVKAYSCQSNYTLNHRAPSLYCAQGRLKRYAKRRSNATRHPFVTVCNDISVGSMVTVAAPVAQWRAQVAAKCPPLHLNWIRLNPPL